MGCSSNTRGENLRWDNESRRIGTEVEEELKFMLTLSTTS